MYSSTHRPALASSIQRWLRRRPAGESRAAVDNNLHRKHSSEPYLSDQVAVEVLTKLELLPVTNYLPDIAQINRNGVAVYVAAGSWALTKQTWLAEAARRLAAQFGSELVTFPGHHGAFLDQPAEFAAVLRGVLHRAQGRSAHDTPRASAPQEATSA